MDRRPRASWRRAARRSAARVRSTATSTIAASAMDFDTWAQMGNRGWGYADVLPYFKRHRDGASATATRPSAAATASSPSPTSMDASAVRGLHRGRGRSRHSRATPTTTAPSRRASPTRSAPSCNGRRDERGARLPASGDEAAEPDGRAPTRTRPASCSTASGRSASRYASGGARRHGARGPRARAR